MFGRSFRIIAGACALLAPLACGGDGTTTPTTDPTAAFTSPATAAANEVIVFDASSSASIDGVSVAQISPANGAAAATTDVLGDVALAVDTGVPVVLKLTKNGFADQFVSTQFPEGIAADAYFTATLRARDAASVLEDASAG